MQAVLGPVAAREALGERIALEMDVTQRGSLRLGHGDRGRRLQGGSSGSSLGHERLPVQEQQALLLRGHRQRPVERRGSRSVTSAGPSMCAASRPGRSPVRGVERAAVAAVDREGVFA